MGETIKVPFIGTITIAIISLFVGVRTNRSLTILHRWNIPDVVTGGLIAAGGLLSIYWLFNLRIEYDLSARDLLLLYFFAGIGLNIRMSDIASGGKPLAILLGLTPGLMVIQNVVAIVSSMAFSLPAGLHVLLGSLALSGGHGTVIAWAPLIDAHFGIRNSLEIGIAVATLGIVVGSLVGGPIAHILISHNHLSGPASEPPIVGLPRKHGCGLQRRSQSLSPPSDNCRHSCGDIVGLLGKRRTCLDGCQNAVVCVDLIMAIILANTLPLLFPKVQWPARSRALALVSDVSLNLFLALSLMSMRIAQLVDVGVPILILGAVKSGRCWINGLGLR
jgi:ESS family glutamate:Na+ symporter